jgi:glycine betaine/proline transport system permease protein
MMRLISKLYFWLTGWKLEGNLAPEIKKAILIGAPHTSNFDFGYSRAALYMMNRPAKYLIKEELMKAPWGTFFKATGGISVKRDKSENLVGHMVELFNRSEELVILLSPEGSRKLKGKWKTGFYHAALQAKVPIVLSSLFSLVGLAFIYNIQLWNETMQTIAMVIAAVSLCIIIGVPLGILTAKNMTAHRIITPILDFMQTLPAFVYLLPAIPFFGLGVVPAVITTLIFAMPPIIRLTDLGIKQVPEELVELGKSFGSTFFQMLFKIELPLARPTILAGINQCIMLSLSMVVIAAMIGAKGLGGVVWTAIQNLKMGMGFEAGVAIVIIAIILDRITQNLGKTN